MPPDWRFFYVRRSTGMRLFSRCPLVKSWKNLIQTSENKNQRQSTGPLSIPKSFTTPNVVSLCGAVCLLAASGALWMQFSRVRAREAIVEVRTLTLKSPIEGSITNLEVQAGEGIQKGQSAVSD